MAHFIIDGFDFGIDASKSKFKADKACLDIVLFGSDSVIKGIMEDESHPWNWLIYPPKIYFRDLPYRPEPTGDFSREIAMKDLDDFEVGLYAMEHCDISPCVLTCRSGLLKIAGKVHHIKAEPLDFDVEYEVPRGARVSEGGNA